MIAVLSTRGQANRPLAGACSNCLVLRGLSVYSAVTVSLGFSLQSVNPPTELSPLKLQSVGKAEAALGLREDASSSVFARYSARATFELKQASEGATRRDKVMRAGERDFYAAKRSAEYQRWNGLLGGTDAERVGRLVKARLYN
jgi:hypothetical protein